MLCKLVRDGAVFSDLRGYVVRVVVCVCVCACGQELPDDISTNA